MADIGIRVRAEGFEGTAATFNAIGDACTKLVARRIADARPRARTAPIACANCGAPPQVGEVACTYCDAALGTSALEPGRTVSFNLMPGSIVGSDPAKHAWLAEQIRQDIDRSQRRRSAALDPALFRVSML